ncbi:MAG TPA: PIN domain-containing protein [Acidobacteriaceae bacterium]|nr:PIN domain-containing protein [Acidobacteriaceae bacterium]
MSRIFWDTNLFIYLFEDYGRHSGEVVRLRQKMIERGDQLITSALSVGEIIAGPLRSGNETLARQYDEAIRSTAIVVNFDLAAARRYAALRAQPRKIRPPDAMQIACAATAGADLFLTNDTNLHKFQIDGIHFITSVDRAPL